ncbi:MAG: hypothetical protein SOZ34_02950 [Clostridia bacterium]|nr:hypothetical protein [Clostridia bacterium]
MKGKRNNPLWICDKLEELLEEYKRKAQSVYGVDYEIYTDIIDDLEKLLYENAN